ncbi:MAG: hypothetical protein NZ524_03195 [Thiobacillaceae bacterium]|nr:hypothetical protein [Thiobacillaceae bacterium]MCX7673443.1 hypothetical protein [Thiobacillaceae bacterium]MDW8323287.1 hypothetical protein [Burkholderiales bacterium]
MSEPKPAAGTGRQTERRVHHKVRAVFVEACALIAPSLAHGAAGLASAAELLRKRYPELSALEIHVLVSAAARLHGQGS